MPKTIALKVDVDTLRGTREGVPNLLRLLEAEQTTATFYFSLGPDHTGWALRRVFRRGFLGKVSRTSVLSHYGWRTIANGVLWPGPDIGKRARAEMLAVREAGHEVGIHCWDHVLWQDFVTRRDEAWTAQQLALAKQRFSEIFGEPAHTHAAAGWQMNSHAFRLNEQLRFASDCRGTAPFFPMVEGKRLRCPQLPTTLPTLDELIGLHGITSQNVAQHLLKLTSGFARPLEVFTLHAELEGQQLLPTLRALLQGWRAQGFALQSLGAAYAQLDLDKLPVHGLQNGEVPGRSGTLACQVA